MNQPVFTVIAGANGCGKSTLTQWAKSLFSSRRFSILTRLPFSSKLASKRGGATLRRERKSFAPLIPSLNVWKAFQSKRRSQEALTSRCLRARGLAYKTRLLYIGTEDVGINMARIRARVLKGGHDVPEEDQLRRYPRSFNNLAKAIDFAEECVLFDNSTKAGHRIVGLKLCAQNAQLRSSSRMGGLPSPITRCWTQGRSQAGLTIPPQSLFGSKPQRTLWRASPVLVL